MIKEDWRRKRLVALSGMLATVSLVLSACKDGNAYKPPPPPQVTVSPPVFGEISDFLEFTGNTQPYHSVQLKARVAGYLEKILFKEGDIVQPGQLLFVIQQNTYQAKLKEAQAQLLADKAKALHAQTELARYSGLLIENAAPQTDVDKWRYERDASQASVMASEAQVELAKLNLSYTEVRAPFRGRISRRYKDPGNLVGSGEDTVLADINQIDPLYAYFTINERDLLKVRGARPSENAGYGAPDKPIQVGLANEEGYPHEGRLDYAGIQVDTETGTLQLRATLPNAQYRILPGLFVRLRVEGPPQPHMLLPDVAVSFDQLGAYVLVVDDKNIVSRRGVTLGIKSGKQRAIETGLAASDRVVVNGMLRAVPGRPVEVVEGSPAESGAPQ